MLNAGDDVEFQIEGIPETRAMNGAVLLMCASLVAYDGDSIYCDDVLMRAMGDGLPHVSGFDTPEINRPKCQEELELARAAKARMQELLDTLGVQIWDSGEIDNPRYKRPLIWIVLPDGRTAGSVLIEEGHARVWTPGYKGKWCPGGS
jgi:micrococcal nuclease